MDKEIRSRKEIFKLVEELLKQTFSAGPLNIRKVIRKFCEDNNIIDVREYELVRAGYLYSLQLSFAAVGVMINANEFRREEESKENKNDSIY